MRWLIGIAAILYILAGAAFALYPRRVEAKKKIIFASGISIRDVLCHCPDDAGSCYCAILIDDGSSTQ